ncbi:hypothetical protein Tco_0527864 [Tanacetum coccineum]
METNKSINRSDTQKNLYNALVESYNTDKDIITSYDDVVTLKRGRDDQDKDEDPFDGSNRGSKRRRSGKEAESSKELKNKEYKSTSASKSASKSQTKSSGKSAHAEEHDQKATDLEDQPNQEFYRGNEDVSPVREALNEDVWHRKPSRPPTPDHSHNPEGKPYPHDLNEPLSLILNEQGRQVIPLDHFINNDLEYLKGGSSSKKYTTSITKTKAVDYGQVKWIKDKVYRIWSPVKVVYDKHAYCGTYHWVTSLKIMKGFGYSHLEEIIVRRQDDHIYKFREGDFKRLRRQDFEDMLLLLVQDKLTNLNLEECYQKKINLKKPDTYRSNLRRITPYTAYPDIQGIIYEDEMNRNRLIRIDELHKFSDGTLNHVRTVLNDIGIGIKMEYLPKIKWSKQNRQRTRVMINAIDKKLRDRSLESFLVKTLTGRPTAAEKDHDDLSYDNLISQIQRDLPKDIPLDSVEVLRFPNGGSFDTARPPKSDEVLKLKNIKKDGYIRFQHQEQYEHVGPEVTRSQEGKRSQDDDKRLCLVDDLKEFKITFMSTDEDDDLDDIAKIFKIKGNLFNYEIPLCKAFNEFNYLLKIDTYLFTFDIQKIKTYEEHKIELNNNITGDLEKPWTDNGVPYQLCYQICKPYHFKNGNSKWPTCSSDINGFCNGRELLGMVRLECMTYFQDHKWYDELADGEQKEETLMHKAKFEESWGDATPGVMKFCAWLKNSFKNFHELDVLTYDPYLDINRISGRNCVAKNVSDTQEHKGNKHTMSSKPTHDPSICQVRRFEMIKYSFDADDEYVAIKEQEYFDHSRTNIDACQAYRELFRIMDEGWLVTKATKDE